jgi:hypothetical protein
MINYNYTFEAISYSDIENVKLIIYKNTNVKENDILFITIENVPLADFFELKITLNKSLIEKDEVNLYNALCN